MGGLQHEIKKVKDKGSKDVKLDGVYIPDPLTGDILLRQKTRSEQEVLQGEQCFGVVMDNICKEVVEQVAEGLVGNGVLLATVCTVSLWYFRTTVKTVFLCPDGLCFQMAKVLVL
jgi:hypothetical protein